MPSTFRSFVRAALLASLLVPELSIRAQTPAPTATLKDAFKGVFSIGVAMNQNQFSGADAKGAALIEREFNSISPENVLKWETVEPQNGGFRFELGDRYVDFGVKHKMFIIGHTLCWHSQLPGWVAQPDAGQDALTKDVLTERLRKHILTVAGHYKGKIHGWDVVNEAINDNGTYRETVFYKTIGKEYLPLAFKWAHEADPAAELYYNDYNLDASDAKRATTIELVKYLREQGAPIHGIGMQGHYNLNGPSVAKIDETIGMFAALGLKVMVTELDIRTTNNAPLTGAVPAPADGAAPGSRRGSGGPPPLTDEQQQALAKRYAEVFAVFVKHRAEITRVTFWGLRDADSWRRSTSPLIFDDNYARKPAYDGVMSALNSAAAKP